MCEDSEVSRDSGRHLNMNIQIVQVVEGVIESRWSSLYTPLKNALKIVLANAVASASTNGVVRYSRGTGIAIPKKYNKNGIGVKTYIKAVDILAKDGWIVDDVSPRNTGEGRICSRFSVTQQLLGYFSLGEVLDQERLNIRSEETIVIRTKEGDLIDYRDNTNIVGMRNVVNKLNEVNSKWDIRHMGEPLDNSHMARIFKGSKTKGGRWYRCEIQQIKQRNKDGTDLPVEQTRLGVTINGGKVVEVDFVSLHPMIVCATNNIDVYDFIGDIYQYVLGEYNTNRFDRKVIKESLLIILNTDSKRSAQGAIQNIIDKYKPKDGKPYGTTFRFKSEVYGKIEVALPALAEHFHEVKEQGLTLQYMDSMIVEEVANVFIEAGKPLLPVHDSFVVKEEDENMLIKAMCQSFRKVTGNDNIPIGLKIKRWDGSEENYID